VWVFPLHTSPKARTLSRSSDHGFAWLTRP
jgi:hypothetical protein